MPNRTGGATLAIRTGDPHWRFTLAIRGFDLVESSLSIWREVD